MMNLEFVFDIKFFAIIPAFNINKHSNQLELEWLWFGFYVGVEGL